MPGLSVCDYSFHVLYWFDPVLTEKLFYTFRKTVVVSLRQADKSSRNTNFYFFGEICNICKKIDHEYYIQNEAKQVGVLPLAAIY